MAGAHEAIHAAVTAWDGVTAAAHRFGGTEFRLGGREIGHIHGNQLVDIPFPTAVGREVVAAGLAAPHHLLPESGWVSVYLRQPGDVDRAIAVLRRSYELARRQKQRRGAAANDGA